MTPGVCGTVRLARVKPGFKNAVAQNLFLNRSEPGTVYCTVPISRLSKIYHSSTSRTSAVAPTTGFPVHGLLYEIEEMKAAADDVRGENKHIEHHEGFRAACVVSTQSAHFTQCAQRLRLMAQGEDARQIYTRPLP